MTSIESRAKSVLDLVHYNNENIAEDHGFLSLDAPEYEQFILRMLIKVPFEEYKIPSEMLWTKPLIDSSHKAQASRNIRQPFVYLTIRHGVVKSKTDDMWHVDGFSQQITHLPEQNYIWTDHTPTECAVKRIDFPKDFNPFKHNIHYFIQDSLESGYSEQPLQQKHVYCMDPYVIHRRPLSTKNRHRTFVRVSFTPIEIIDCNNTYNALIGWRQYSDDRVKLFRDKLVRYKSK